MFMRYVARDRGADSEWLWGSLVLFTAGYVYCVHTQEDAKEETKSL